jgi:hypothetical protein
METVIAWTRQASQVLDEIEKTGSYHVREEYVREKNGEISDYYLEMYRWYTRQARRRIRIPEEYDLPIWLALSEDQKLPPAQGTVTFTLEIPADQIVICNYDNWGYRLNNMYVPADAADERRHNDELEKLGIGNEALLISSGKGNFYPLLKQKMIKSWDRVFLPSDNIANNVGTIWQIVPEWIREVEHYD